MTKTLLLVVAATATLIGTACASSATNEKQLDGMSTAKQTRPAEKSAVRHVVCFKFKPTTSPDKITKIEESFCALKNKIPSIVSFEWGTNTSPEHLNKNFTHCFVLTFKNDKDRDAYLVNPNHKEFVRLLTPAIDEALVLDFHPKNST